MERKIIQHFSHEHALELLPWGAEAFCSICIRLIQKDRRRYFCFLCGYLIHGECSEFPEYINHSLHPLHPLKFAKRSLNNGTCCYYCENPFNNNEYVYGCDDQLCPNFYMHGSCAMIPLPTITSHVDGDQDLGVLQFVCHQKPMTLVEPVDDYKRKAKCFACQSDWSLGSAYSCTSIKCENFLHKSCAKLSRKIQHPFHSHHPLILQVSKPRSCRSCCKKHCRLIFSCPEDGCDFHLCIECRSLNTTVRHRSHDHSLSLVEKSSCTIQCNACEKSYENHVLNEINQTQSFLFRCMDCVFNYHFLCGPLPSAIKYEYHMHHLILSDHFVIKDDSKDDSNEYYCEVCEEEMDQSFRIYYCEECKYTAHIHCLIPEIMKVIKGDTNDVVLKALGDHRRYQYLGMESTAYQPTNLTLKDIMETLTQSEKEMLNDPFGFDDPSSKIRRREWYQYYQRQNSYFNLEGSNEDIDRLLQFFLFNTNEIDFFNLSEELYYFTVEEGLLKLLDDKYLRQQVEDVRGYMIPKTLAPVLKTLLHKYGDLGGWRSLSTAMKSINSTFLCIVIDKMCKTKVEDITRDDLKHYFFYLTGIREVTGFKTDKFLDDLDDLETFLGFEAMRYEKDTCENVDNKIATLEAKLERWKKSRDRLKTFRTHGYQKSDFMKECLKKASERKHKYWGDKWF